MPRPIKPRRIFFQPQATYFKPAGISISSLEGIKLSFEEIEAIRLIDLENIDQIEASKKMKISQPTLSRLLNDARKKLADALINGKSIKIEGGIFKMEPIRGNGLGRGRGRGFGRGRMGGPVAAGPDGYCVCPKCGYKEIHKPGIPCYEKTCPKCGENMVRE